MGVLHNVRFVNYLVRSSVMKKFVVSLVAGYQRSFVELYHQQSK